MPLPGRPFDTMLPAGRSIGAREEGIELRTEDCPFVIPAFPAGRFAEEAAETPAEFADRNAGPCTPLLARSCAIVCESSGRPGFFARADCRAENGTAPGAGVERVTTERLRAAGDGKCALTAPRTPRTLRCVGVTAAVELTRPEAIDRTEEPLSDARATDCEFTNVERGTAVIAPATRWFAKWIPPTFPVLRIVLLIITVFLMLMLVMNTRLQRNPGKNGSPKPSGNHPIGAPNPKPKKKFDPPTKPTKAGAKNGRAKNGPGHQPQKPPTNAQRP